MSTIDIESFLKAWGSGSNLDYRYELRTWMQSSYSDPVTFWEEFFPYSHKEMEGLSETILFERYDFYSDCILRHLGKGLIALKVIDSNGVAKSWSYDEIHKLVQIQVPHWKERYDLKAGQSILLVFSYGIHFLIALLSALYLGLTICIFPLKDRYVGEELLQKAKELFKPDIIAIESSSEEIFSQEFLPIDLTLKPTQVLEEKPHIYPALEPLQIHLELHSLEPKEPVVIEAMRSYLMPLRDGLLAFHLKPAYLWARPLFSMHLEEPTATLAALLKGASLLHIADDYLINHPKALEDHEVHVLGISLPLFELWLKTPGAPKSKFWYHSPLFGNDRNFKAFAEMNRLSKIPRGQILIDKKKGSVILFSQPKVIDAPTYMHPSLGSPWKLLKIGDTKAPATEGFGLFCIEPAEPSLILAQAGDEWCPTSSLFPLKEGVPYPTFLIEEVVKTLDFVHSCLIVAERDPQHLLQQQMALLIFVSPKELPFLQQKTKEWSEEIRSLIKTKVGEGFIPDKSLFFALYPKLKKGTIDRVWTENQYLSGALFHKQKSAPYRNLNLLRCAIYENISQKKGIS